VQEFHVHVGITHNVITFADESDSEVENMAEQHSFFSNEKILSS
jgi:hypothetical protein